MYSIGRRASIAAAIFAILAISIHLQVESFSCVNRGKGKFEDEEDNRMYYQCFKFQGELQYTHNECPAGTCFNGTNKKCLYEHCPDNEPPPAEPYDCNDRNFHCEAEGIFADTSDASVYFRCLKVEDTWEIYCYACNSDRFCYSNPQHACIKSETSCEGYEEGRPDSVGASDDNLAYTCDGYTETAFPCSEVGPGVFAKPGDKSVYFECVEKEEGELVAVCHECPRHTRSCFDEDKNECVPNCGKEIVLAPYDCFGREFECVEEGVFADKEDSSVFYKCTKNSTDSAFDMSCGSCNKQFQTCFDNAAKACIYAGGQDCRNLTDGVSRNVGDFGVFRFRIERRNRFRVALMKHMKNETVYSFHSKSERKRTFVLAIYNGETLTNVVHVEVTRVGTEYVFMIYYDNILCTTNSLNVHVSTRKRVTEIVLRFVN